MFALILLAVGVLILLIVQFQKKQSNKAKSIRDEQLKPYNFKVVREFDDYTLGVDEEQKKVVYAYWDAKPFEIPFEKIINCEVLKDNKTIHKISATGTIVGGALAGGLGAAIGSQAGKKSKEKVQSLDLLINIDDLENPTLKINFFHQGMEDYKLQKEALPQVERWEGIFKVILERNKKDV